MVPHHVQVHLDIPHGICFSFAAEGVQKDFDVARNPSGNRSCQLSLDIATVALYSSASPPNPSLNISLLPHHPPIRKKLASSDQDVCVALTACAPSQN